MLVVFSHHRAIETIKETLTTVRNMVHEGKEYKTTVRKIDRKCERPKTITSVVAPLTQ